MDCQPDLHSAIGRAPIRMRLQQVNLRSAPGWMDSSSGGRIGDFANRSVNAQGGDGENRTLKQENGMFN
jgi:hypothetical protein